MPNIFANLVLLVWPFVCVVMFRRLPIERALVWCILAGYLLLPPGTEFDPPLLPSMNKFSITSLSVFVICVFLLKQRVRVFSGMRIVSLLLAAYILSTIPTVLTNQDPVLFQSLEGYDPITFVTFQLPGLSARDILSITVSRIITLLPFLLARSLLASEKGMRELVYGLAIATLIYSIPALFEIAVAPILNIKFYGFFQHDWGQMIREGGFRPIVFLNHGLWVAIFMATGLLATITMFRNAAAGRRLKWAAAVIYLIAVLRACKSLGALAIGLLLLPVMLFLNRKMQIRVALILALIGVTYPMSREVGLIPLDKLVETAALVDPERAGSLEFRFSNEELLLERAQQKPWFGWGGWSRNLLRDANSGSISSIPDGNWILLFGTSGWVGYVIQMSLLSLSIAMLAYLTINQRNDTISPHAATIAIIIAATMMDMLLNDTLIPFIWLCAGALLGHVETITDAHKQRQPRHLRYKPVMHDERGARHKPDRL